ncbi:carbon-nitrogen hydrolase family protein [Janibacter sp. G56]|uniref:carbon-nitrogen hydrolase family protein n=1 Tax=Janibacter sp. G56 TaxID=3418717 RepID=UPI003D00B004
MKQVTTLRVAAGQISSTRDTRENLASIAEVVARAGAAGARLVVLPEAAMASFEMKLSVVAQPLDGPFADALRGIAERHGVVLVTGMFTPADEAGPDGRERVHNTLLVTGPGVEETTYRKVHLYDAFGTKESDTVAPGDEYVTVEVDGWTVGLATCFDVRFAEQFTELGRRGADLVVLPASWGDGPGKAEQWDLLCQARAHDAQAWLLSCGQAWTSHSTKGPYGIGRSALVHPSGAVRARLGGEPDLLVATIDRAVVAKVREVTPIL